MTDTVSIPASLDVNGRSYRIVKLLGKGKRGYSYLAADEVKNYVLKQIHHEPCDCAQPGNKIEAELNDYGRLRQIGIRLPEMLDIDMTQERILKEYIEGPTIFNCVLEECMEQSYLEQMRQMCARLYASHTNIDYFPTNFVVQSGVLFYIDYECSDYREEWNFENWGIKYWSKTPEFLQYVREQS